MKNYDKHMVVTDIIENDDGTAELRFDLSDEFIKYFKEVHNLDEFTEEIFQEIMLKALKSAVEKPHQGGV